MFKNNIYKVALGIIACTVILLSCQDDPEFPDPGFEIKDKDIEVRRDTIDTYTLEFDMDVPNGLDKIEILNGNDYSLIDEVNDYNGKSNFLFSYDIDLEPFTTDTVLNYIVRAIDKNERSINKGLTLNVKKKSEPQIIVLGGDEVIVNAPALLAKAKVETGLAALKSIDIQFESKVVQNISFSDTLVYDYNLKEQIILGTLEKDREYKLEITVNDLGFEYTTSEGKEIKREAMSYTHNIIVKRGDSRRAIPKQIVLTDRGKNSTQFFVYANNNERIDSIVIQRWDSWTTDWKEPEKPIVFKYNELNMVDTIRFEDDDVKNVFTYLTGTTLLEKVESWPIDATTATVSSEDIEVQVSNIVYNSRNQPVSYHYTPEDYFVNNLRYVDPFEIGEYMAIEHFGADYKMDLPVEPEDRDYYDAFAPIYTPLYIEGLPHLCEWEGGGHFTEMLNLLCFNPYLATEIRDKNGELTREYKYVTDENGNLTSITWEYQMYGRGYLRVYSIMY
jgi:hypothetical protein